MRVHPLPLLAALLGSASAAFAIDVSINAPAADATVSGVVAISGTTQDAGPTGRVAVAIDGGGFQLATGVATWSYSWDTTLVADGQHTITARARECLTCPPVETQIAVTVDNAPAGLAVTIDQPLNGEVLWGPVTVAGTAAGAASVSVAVDGGPFQPATATDNWTFAIDAAQLAPGDHQIHARADDGAGGQVVATAFVIVSPESPPAPDCNAAVPGLPLPYRNTASPPRLDLAGAPVVYLEIFGHSENRGYDAALQSMLDADPPGGRTYVVTNHWIGGHETWRWTTPGQQGYEAIEDVLANIQGPAIALILTSNNTTFPINAPDPNDANYGRFVAECESMADHLFDAGAGVQMCYFSAHRMKPKNLMPSYYENLAIEDLLGNAAQGGKHYLKPGPAQHDLHWCCYPDCYDPDFSHTNAAGDLLMAEAWYHLLRIELTAPGDCDADGTVSAADLLEGLVCLSGPEVTADVACRCADVNRDDDVDLLDLVTLQAEFGGN